MSVIESLYSLIFGPVHQDTRKKSTFHWTGNTEFESRSDEEVLADVNVWVKYLHPRYEDVLSAQQVESALIQIAQDVSRGQDPMFGSADSCVLWHGDVTMSDRNELQAAICFDHLVGENLAFTNRLLVFLFANDECYEQIRELPKDAFSMKCGGNQLCINLQHVCLC
eukprot:TRINITY_DN35169_c0_g1_i1.p1 TRINITY_DN35169_c0_g1~~TRINITY_DN35169_c0_g1_i1.p1  ORF type:complete len:167 (+),score=27.27 TRINITY_DN35169_c0_g1_i1:81-581(+)